MALAGSAMQLCLITWLQLIIIISGAPANAQPTIFKKMRAWKERLCGGGGLLFWLCGSKFPTEYTYGDERGISFKEQIRLMEQIDAEYDRRYQESIARETDIFIVAPTPALVYDLETVQLTHNPQLYSEGTYNIAFRLGSKFHFDYPYLTVYLTKCSNENEPRTSQMLPIKTMLVHRNLSISTPTMETQEGLAWRYNQHTSDIFQTKDGAWVFEWTMPRSSFVFPDPDYCFLFDMSSFDPTGITSTGEYRKLSQLKPQTAASFVTPAEMYHWLKPSGRFEIIGNPPLFSPEWFSRQFGGKDLEHFIGDELYSFRFFMNAYNNEDSSSWNEEEFSDMAKSRANYFFAWFTQLLDETSSERHEGGFHVGILPNKLDSGYVQMEDRRKARNRAAGLLYHVNGRETLFTIGMAMLDVSQAYYKSLMPLQRRPNPFGLKLKLIISQNILEIYSASYFRFKIARERIYKWSLELKKWCKGTVPTAELFSDIAAKFPGGHERVKLPISNRKVYLPRVIQAKIMENMRIMVNHEIRTTIALVGDRLLQEEGKMGYIFSRLSGRLLKDHWNYAELAAALRVYGTKFVTMANTFMPGRGHFELFKEEDSVESSCRFCVNPFK